MRAAHEVSSSSCALSCAGVMARLPRAFAEAEDEVVCVDILQTMAHHSRGMMFCRVANEVCVPHFALQMVRFSTVALSDMP